MNFLQKVFFFSYVFHMWKHNLHFQRSGIYLKKKKKKKKIFLSPFIFKKIYSCLPWTEACQNLNRSSCMSTLMSFFSSECLETWIPVSALQYLSSHQFISSHCFSTISFHHLFQILLPNQFLSSFVSSFWQFSSHLETAASAVFFICVW